MKDDRRSNNRRDRDRRHWSTNGSAGPLSERRCRDHLVAALVLMILFVLLEHYLKVTYVAKGFEFVGAAVANRLLFGAGG